MTTRDRWVFAYGSLLWRPGFGHEECVPCVLRGYHRSFCLYSHHHRGTPARPGLVLGLSPGGECHGAAIRVRHDDWPAVKAYLDARELISKVYVPTEITVHAPDRAPFEAHTYIADPTCAQYDDRLNAHQTARIITTAHGKAGSNLEYLENTVGYLDRMGIVDPPLHDLMDLIRREYGGSPGGHAPWIAP